MIQLPDVVSEVSPLIKRLLGEKITYYVQHDRNLGPVRADPQQLEQVIMNLAVNARDAIQGNGGQSRGNGTGRISLFTRHLHATEVVKLGSEVLPAADYTVLIVQDTGGGIPPNVLPPNCSNHSSPPRNRARAPALACRPLTGSSSNRAGSSLPTISSTRMAAPPARASPSICRSTAARHPKKARKHARRWCRPNGRQGGKVFAGGGRGTWCARSPNGRWPGRDTR